MCVIQGKKLGSVSFLKVHPAITPGEREKLFFVFLFFCSACRSGKENKRCRLSCVREGKEPRRRRLSREEEENSGFYLWKRDVCGEGPLPPFPRRRRPQGGKFIYCSDIFKMISKKNFVLPNYSVPIKYCRIFSTKWRIPFLKFVRLRPPTSHSFPFPPTTNHSPREETSSSSS